MNYIDTSLVIAALDTSSPAKSKDATALLTRTREKVVSELFLVELASVFSRKSDLIAAVHVEDTSPATVMLAFMVYVMSKYDLKLVEPSIEHVATPFGRVDAESSSCLALASELKLRSLDLLHVSHLVSIMHRGFIVESFLTSNSDYQRAEKFLEEQGVRLIIQKVLK